MNTRLSLITVIPLFFSGCGTKKAAPLVAAEITARESSMDSSKNEVTFVGSVRFESEAITIESEKMTVSLSDGDGEIFLLEGVEGDDPLSASFPLKGVQWIIKSCECRIDFVNRTPTKGVFFEASANPVGKEIRTKSKAITVDFINEKIDFGNATPEPGIEDEPFLIAE